jgi:hypothetical protein
MKTDDKLMRRRDFLNRAPLCALALADAWPSWPAAQDRSAEKGVPAPEPIPEPHFPDRLHLFIWRNWELANTDRLAQVLGTTPEKVLQIGAAMGLPKKAELTENQLRRIYITVIRQNWHILPDEQLMQLLGWDSKEYEYHLKEDDFLWIKLGSLKPRCDVLRYKEPSPAAKRRAEEIRRLVEEALGPSINEPGEPAFAFVELLSDAKPVRSRNPQNQPSENEVDLTRGWILMRPMGDSGVPLTLVEKFQAYLEQAMACEVRLGAEERRAEARAISFALSPALAKGTGGFEVRVTPEEIGITGSDLDDLRQAVYYLQDQMEGREGPYLAQGTIQRDMLFNPRYVYSYFALYGDPLMETEIDPFPDGFLEKLARAGVNGVWLQAVLRNLAPSKSFSGFGEGWETRVQNLNKLIERARDYGVKVYLYLNEPRSMPAEFFDRHPEIKGTHDPGESQFSAMCTSTAEVREWLAESLAHLFSKAPGLGGIFCITASENLTNCYSHGHAEFCPRCAKRDGSEVIAEVIQTFREGVRRSSAQARIIAWDWGWGKDWIRNGADPAGVIARLPADVALLSVSEWGKQIDRGGHPVSVEEYSISVVGPGERALGNWGMARKRGLPVFAKVQWSCTWEISAVPYVPVPNLILRHCQNLLKTGINGLMASWTEGGYPSPNFEVAKECYFSPAPESTRVLSDVAARRYGCAAAPQILEAWRIFSRAFLQYPMEGGGVVYHVPVQHGPSNLLRLHPTGYKASMMLFPYDDYHGWVGSYPVEEVQNQFGKMAALWEPGLEEFRRALKEVPVSKQPSARKDLGIAETCYLHFKSVTNQILFCRSRVAYQEAPNNARPALAARMVKIATEEIEIAKRQYAIAREDSRIAFEASNHYYYRPLDLVEKVLNCHYVINAIHTTMGS